MADMNQIIFCHDRFPQTIFIQCSRVLNIDFWLSSEIDGNVDRSSARLIIIIIITAPTNNKPNSKFYSNKE